MQEDIEQTSVQTLAEESEKMKEEDYTSHTIKLDIDDCGLSAWEIEPLDQKPPCRKSQQSDDECDGSTPPGHSPSYSMLIAPQPHSYSRMSIRSDSIHRPRYKITRASPARSELDSTASLFKSDSHKRLLEAVISADLVEPPKAKVKPIRLFKSNGLNDKTDIYARLPSKPSRTLLLDPTPIHRRNDAANVSLEDRRSFTLSPVDPFPQGRVRRL